MTKTSKRIPNDLLSNYDLMFMFQVPVQRIYVWKRKKNLQSYEISGTVLRPTVRYSLKEVLTWAKLHRKKIKFTPKIVDGVITWKGPGAKTKFKKFLDGKLGSYRR